MSTAKVSVIIPLYNAEKFIAETIQSVLNQTYQNIEVIVVDDGSSDHSYTIAKHINDQRILVFKQKNKGASAARNYGLTMATGDYIQFLDADDLLNPAKIEAQIEILSQHPNYISVCNTIHFFDGQDFTTLKPSNYEEPFLRKTENAVEFLTSLWGGYTDYGSMVSIHAWLIPKTITDTIGPWNENLTYDDDGEYFSRVMMATKGIKFSEKAICYYRKLKISSLSDLGTKDRLQSMLTAALLKTTTLLRHSQSYASKLAAYKILTGVALKCLPKHYDLYKIANNALPKISVKNYQPSIGGPITQKLVTLFGWKTIRTIQYYLRLKE